MRHLRWVYIAFTLAALAACSPGSNGGPVIPPLFKPTPTLPPPIVTVISAPDARAAMTQFLEALKNNDLTAMYAMLSSETQAAVAQDVFLTKYNDALNTMGAATLDYQVTSQLLSPAAAQVGFKITYHTALVGDLEREMVANLKLEQGAWKLVWDEGLILPELAGGNVLKMDYRIPGRGDIYDRDGKPIVTQSDAYALGIKPGDLSPNSSGGLVGALARLCGRTTDSIENAYASAAPEWYVPICEASVDEVRDILNLNSAGLVVTPYNARFYLDQGIAPQVVGYSTLIPKEQLDQYRRQGYRGDEKVGLSGIEKSMEQYLAGKHGGDLYVVDPNGQIVQRLAASEPEPAASVYLTINRNLQHYGQLAFGDFQGRGRGT